MIIPIPYAIIFGVTYIAFIIVIIICTQIYPNYSILGRTISGLGNPEHKTARIFNISIIIMGIVYLPFPYFLFLAMPKIILTYIGTFFFFLSPIGMILVGFFPENKEKMHAIAAVLAMGGPLLANLILIYPFLISNLNIIIPIISIILLILCVPLCISALKSLQSYEPDKKIEKIIFNINLWEWLQFIVLRIWVLAIYINLILI